MITGYCSGQGLDEASRLLDQESSCCYVFQLLNDPNTLSPWVAFGVRLRDMSDNVSNLVASMRSSIVTAIAQISCA